MGRTTRTQALAAAVSVSIATLLWSPSAVDAGGLYLTEWATPSMGTAGVGGDARADDASTAIHNPAGLTRLDDHQLSLGLAPGWGTVKFNPSADTPTDGSAGGDQSGLVPITSLAYAHKLSDDFAFGLGVLSFAGASLDPSNDWVGRNEITQLSLLSVTAKPSLAYRVNDWLSVAAGPMITYGVLDWDLRAPLPGPGNLEARVSINDADDVAVAAHAELLLEYSESVRLGIVYISETELELSGNVGIPAGANASFDLDLPLAQTVRTSLYADTSDRVSLMVSLAWEDWSTLDSTPLSIRDGSVVVPLGMKDTWRIGGGIHYKYSDTLTLQSGISYDSSALDAEDRISALPIDRNIRVAVGALHDYSENVRMAFAFEWLSLGNGRIRDNAFVTGEYERNDVFFLCFNTTWKKLPWSGKASFASSASREGEDS